MPLCWHWANADEKGTEPSSLASLYIQRSPNFAMNQLEKPCLWYWFGIQLTDRIALVPAKQRAQRKARNANFHLFQMRVKFPLLAMRVQIWQSKMLPNPFFQCCRLLAMALEHQDYFFAWELELEPGTKVSEDVTQLKGGKRIVHRVFFRDIENAAANV
ncbi:hypothetical protein DUI87_09642 [Hirundo rustica rustica]|uniref:Uncharacterized protein n=1 Tax=Hirundo rustica rustica TaxID=333673 RepID=A0A3M0KN61_HIRRU|nr:hypothetical protein DUI87_09642 [Hirundo rustica rustica]